MNLEIPDPVAANRRTFADDVPHLPQTNRLLISSSRAPIRLDLPMSSKGLPFYRDYIG